MTGAAPPRIARDAGDYRPLLALFYEEEVAGEAYFDALAEVFDTPAERAALVLLADMERHVIACLRPLLDHHGLVPRPSATLREEGRREAGTWRGRQWREFIADMRVAFPAYVQECEALERVAPTADLARLCVVGAHERACIEFAERAAAGRADAVDALDEWLAASERAMAEPAD